MSKYEVTFRTKYAKKRHTHYKTWDNRRAAQAFATFLNKPVKGERRENKPHNARVRRIKK